MLIEEDYPSPELRTLGIVLSNRGIPGGKGLMSSLPSIYGLFMASHFEIHEWRSIMKYLMLILPSLLPFCVAGLLAIQSSSLPTPNSPEERKAAIHELQVERGKISARISILEAEGRNFLPR